MGSQGQPAAVPVAAAPGQPAVQSQAPYSFLNFLTEGFGDHEDVQALACQILADLATVNLSYEGAGAGNSGGAGSGSGATAAKTSMGGGVSAAAGDAVNFTNFLERM